MSANKPATWDAQTVVDNGWQQIARAFRKHLIATCQGENRPIAQIGQDRGIGSRGGQDTTEQHLHHAWYRLAL